MGIGVGAWVGASVHKQPGQRDLIDIHKSPRTIYNVSNFPKISIAAAALIVSVLAVVYARHESRPPAITPSGGVISCEHHSTISEPSKSIEEAAGGNLIRIGGVQARREDNGISIADGHHSIVVPLPQPDYGELRAIRPTDNGAIAVLGDQMSYLVSLVGDDSDPLQVRVSQVLSRYAKRCELLQVAIGDCPTAPAEFSNDTRRVFVAGYDAWGMLQSYVFIDGMPRALEGADGAPIWLLGDSKDSNFAVLAGASDKRYLYDGKTVRECR